MVGRVLKAAAPLAVLAVAIWLSVGYGLTRGEHLPGSSFGWTALFYVERAAIGLSIIGAVWLVGWRALHGHFPLKIANIEYADELKASADTAGAHEQRLKLIEDYLGLVDAPPQEN
jgi:hypothetical protein